MSPVNKEHFLHLINTYSATTLQEAEHVVTLRDNFPFSQILQSLAARVSKDHNFKNNQHLLNIAAVYSSDRSVLKEIMTSEPDDYTSVDESLNTPDAIIRSNTNIENGDGLAEEVIHDLARLTELRNNFEMLFIDDAAISPKTFQGVTEVSAAPEKDTMTKKERIIAMAKAFKATSPDATIKEEPTPMKPGRRKRQSHDIIDEIAVSKEELTPESDKHKEQLQIIEKFIKIQPSISEARDNFPPPADLSTLKTGEFSDHVVSETLVEILVKQGKKDKAIEVLKKLIWKFPQKKAYFAAQIEDLKK